MKGLKVKKVRLRAGGSWKPLKVFLPEEWLDDIVILRKDNLEEIYRTN